MLSSYDGEKERRPVLMRLIKHGFASTLALDDRAAAAHFWWELAQELFSRGRKHVL